MIENIDDKYIIFDANNNGYITLWDLQTGKMLKQIRAETNNNDNNIYSMCLLNNDSLIYGVNNQINIYDLAYSRHIDSYNVSSKIQKISKIKYKDGKVKIITGGYDGKLYLWE